MNNGEMDKERQLIGYCNYCLETIFDDEDFLTKNNLLYHLDCWKLQNGFEEELNFGE